MSSWHFLLCEGEFGGAIVRIMAPDVPSWGFDARGACTFANRIQHFDLLSLLCARTQRGPLAAARAAGCNQGSLCTRSASLPPRPVESPRKSECRVTLAPILPSLSRSVVSNQWPAPFEAAVAVRETVRMPARTNNPGVTVFCDRGERPPLLSRWGHLSATDTRLTHGPFLGVAVIEFSGGGTRTQWRHCTASPGEHDRRRNPSKPPAKGDPAIALLSENADQSVKVEHLPRGITDLHDTRRLAR